MRNVRTASSTYRFILYAWNAMLMPKNLRQQNLSQHPSHDACIPKHQVNYACLWWFIWKPSRISSFTIRSEWIFCICIHVEEARGQSRKYIRVRAKSSLRETRLSVSEARLASSTLESTHCLCVFSGLCDYSSPVSFLPLCNRSDDFVISRFYTHCRYDGWETENANVCSHFLMQ